MLIVLLKAMFELGDDDELREVAKTSLVGKLPEVVELD
jgi:hypothetical protein